MARGGNDGVDADVDSRGVRAVRVFARDFVEAEQTGKVEKER